MSMLKLLGAGLTILSCSAAGFLICANMKKRIRTLEELRRMTVMLSAEIRCGGVLLEESFAGIAGRVKPPVQTFLLHLQEKMKEGEQGSFAELFGRQVELDFQDCGLKKSDLESLKLLGSRLGYLDLEQQKNTLEYYLAQVGDAWTQAWKEYREKEKLFRYLGISGGVFLVIMLY